MTRDQALTKIKKCLALGRSTNPHEAAAAMRQAQKLMAEHGLNDADVKLSDVSTATCSTRTNSQPRWEVRLAQSISNAFGCDLIWSRSGKFIGGRCILKCEVIFIGLDPAVQIAGYAWDILSRQCAKARLMHIRKQPARCKPITLTARGDAFAWGWVAGVQSKLEAFTAPESNRLLIEQYKSITWPNSTTVKPKDRTVGKSVSDNDLQEGYLAGKTAELNRCMTGSASQELLA